MVSPRSLRGIAAAATLATAVVVGAGVALAAPGDITALLAADVNQTGLPTPARSDSRPADIINVAGTLFFSANDGVHGRELWKSDGTSAGTVRLSDINPGVGDGLTTSPELVNVGGTVFFRASTGTSDDLYKEEPPYTSAPVKVTINPTGGSSPHGLTNFNGTLFLEANDGSSAANELWKSDGGPVGVGHTEMVANINPAPNEGSFPDQLTPVGSTLFFKARDGTDAEAGEVWKTDGTVGNATKLDVNPAPGEGSDPDSLIDVNGTLFFIAENGTVGRELFKAAPSDSSATAIDIVSGSGGSDPQEIGALGATAYFDADDGVHGSELWKSNGGTVASGGTAMVADINTDPTPAADSFPDPLFAFGGKIFFGADDGVHGAELWKSNGGSLGPGGTEMVADLVAGPGSSAPNEFAAFDGGLWFRTTSDPPSVSELWRTDGVTTTTFDINPGPASSTPNDLVAGPGALFFEADDGVHGQELWKATAEPGPVTSGGGGGDVAPPPAPLAPTETQRKRCKKAKKHASSAKKKCKKRK